MAHRNVVLAVESRLKAGFTDCPVLVENETGEAPLDGNAFLLLDFPYARSEQATIGSPGANRYHEEGAFRLLLSIRRGFGAHQGRLWLDQIADLFRGAYFDGVRCYAPQSASTDDRNEVAGYFRLSMIVPFDYSLNG